jgi:hypothetical protein
MLMVATLETLLQKEPTGHYFLHREYKVPKELKVLKAHKVLLVLKELKVHRVLLDLKVLKVLKEPKEHKVYKAYKEQRVHKVLKDTLIATRQPLLQHVRLQ